MPAESDEAAFLAAIRSARYDIGLRRVFADWLDEAGRHEEADYQRRWTAAVGAAEDWLVAFGRACDIPYPDVVKAGHDWLRDGTDYVQDWNLTASNALCDGGERAAFWRSWEAVTGVPSGVDPAAEGNVMAHPFRCDCGGYDDPSPRGEDALPVGLEPR